MTVRVQDSADVSPDAVIGEGSSIWHLAQVREHAVLGSQCVVGRGAYIGEGVVMGQRCKVQNYALVYEPARLGDGVFIGPAVVLTNDHFPRAVNPDGSLNTDPVPARRIGWVGRAGEPLVAVSEGEEGYLAGATRWRCPVTGTVFDQSNDTIREVTR